MRYLRLGFFVGCLSAHAIARAQSSGTPQFPRTGVDYSGIDAFYHIADLLATNVEPTTAQWNALMTTPGYRLVEIDNPGIRKRIDLALKPSRHVERATVLSGNGDGAGVLRHIIRAAAARDSIRQLRALLERSISDSVTQALAATSRFLPAGTIEKTSRPFMGFAIFGPDGYAEPQGILLDPLYVKDNGLVELLAHELQHSYAATIDRTRTFAELMAMRPAPIDGALFFAIFHLRNEGIADMVDKPHPLVAQSAAGRGYAERYNAAYEQTPQLLRVFDSLLVAVADDPSSAQKAGSRAQRLFISNGHPNGAYIARTILETFGLDSLMNGARSPIAFMRTYAEAEVKRGQPAPFSPKSMGVMSAMEKRYIRP